MRRFKRVFTVLAETPDVAEMNVYGITRILTFNTDDFARYPGIIPISPQGALPQFGQLRPIDRPKTVATPRAAGANG